MWLTESDIAGARQTAQRLVAAIAGSTTRDRGRVIDFNISVGMASFHLTSAPSLDALIRAADDALYRAKRKGRNRIHSAHDREGETRSSPSATARAVEDTGVD